MTVKLTSLKLQLGGLLMLLIGFGLNCLSNSECSLWTADQRGYRWFQQAQYAQAAANFSDPEWQAAALFKQGEFAKAALLLSGFDTAEAAFNQGNALVMQGKYEAAVARYARALQLRPDWEGAIINREIAAGRAELLTKKGADMTGGELGADEIVFDQAESSANSGEEQVDATQQMSDAELRSVWLRQVQTRPADFLRAKFARQYATRKVEGD